MGCAQSRAVSRSHAPLLRALFAAQPHDMAAVTPLSQLLSSYLGGTCRRVIALDGEFQSFELAPEHQARYIANDFHGPHVPGTPGPFSFMREIGIVTFCAADAGDTSNAGAAAASSDAAARLPRPAFALASAVTRHLPLLFNYERPTVPFDNPEALNQTFALVGDETRKALSAAYEAINLQVRTRLSSGAVQFPVAPCQPAARSRREPTVPPLGASARTECARHRRVAVLDNSRQRGWQSSGIIAAPTVPRTVPPPPPPPERSPARADAQP